jgi:hypothetical protein
LSGKVAQPCDNMGVTSIESLMLANLRDSILVTPTLSHGWATLPDNS